MNARHHVSRPKEPLRHWWRIDWLKWLIVLYVLGSGLLCWASVFNPLFMAAFYLGMVAWHAHVPHATLAQYLAFTRAQWLRAAGTALGTSGAVWVGMALGPMEM